jgi:hypothetical protein
MRYPDNNSGQKYEEVVAILDCFSYWPEIFFRILKKSAFQI